MMRIQLRTVAHFLALVALAAVVILPARLAAERIASANNPFPAPVEIEPAVRFWTRIYTEVETKGGLLHDSRNLGVVYEVIDLPKSSSRRAKERHTDARKTHYRAILRTLAGGKRSGLSGEEARVLALFSPNVSNKELRDASSRVRFQLGQADKFRAGIIRSGAYVDHIEENLAKMGLPSQIAALPHVESSYTPHAYSAVGAAGLWQFTRSTGRRYMRVDNVIDERLDPYIAAIAAARLLEQNYRVTGSWPLAITAYNHGASGMRRATRKLGTKDIAKIIRDYRSRTFGFASRNFYPEFLAASRIAEHPERYFGQLVLDVPIEYATVELPFYTTPAALSKAFGISTEGLKTANPSLRVSVWRGHKRVPRGFEFKIPVGELSQPPLAALETIPESARYASQTRDTFHVVRRGESLSIIARRYGVRMSDIQHLNGLRSKHRIRAGQKLRLPTDHKGSHNSTSASTSAPVERSTPPADGLYTVRRGDSIYKIAKRFGMSERDLSAANDLRNRHRIYAGQVLRVSTALDKAYTGAGHASTAVVATGSPTAQKTAASTSAQPDPHPQAMAILTPARSAEPSPVPRDPETVLSDNMVDVEVSTFVSVAAEEPEAEPMPLKLIADPSDYSVASDGTVEIQATETLGHVAEWLGVRASRLRAINHLKYGEPLAVNSDLRLDFSQTTPEEFERRRLEYHRGIQEEFFEEWEISGTETHRMRRGDSLWVLSHRRFNVPLWLLRQYNPDIDFEAPAAGSQITVPLLRRRELDAGAQAIAGGELAAG